MIESDDRREEMTAARIATLRESILQRFPAERYDGPITPADGKWPSEAEKASRVYSSDEVIYDDEEDLYNALKGKTWQEVPPEFLDFAPDGYLLLTEHAFEAFLPAWLIRSLDDINGENPVREYLAYAFIPNPDAGELSPSMKRKLQTLNSQQVSVLRSLWMEFAQSEAYEFIRGHAVRAVASIG